MKTRFLLELFRIQSTLKLIFLDALITWDCFCSVFMTITAVFSRLSAADCPHDLPADIQNILFSSDSLICITNNTMQIFSRTYNNTWFVIIKLNLYFQDTQRCFTNNENSFMTCVSNVTSSPLPSWGWVHFTWFVWLEKKEHFKRGRAAVTHRALTQRSLDLCHCYSWHVAKHVIQAVFTQKLREGEKIYFLFSLWCQVLVTPAIKTTTKLIHSKGLNGISEISSLKAEKNI